MRHAFNVPIQVDLALSGPIYLARLVMQFGEFLLTVSYDGFASFANHTGTHADNNRGILRVHQCPKSTGKLTG